MSNYFDTNAARNHDGKDFDRFTFNRNVTFAPLPVQEKKTKRSTLTDQERDEMKVYGPMEISEILHCSVEHARQVMHRSDFPPLLRCGRRLLVSKKNFDMWFNDPHKARKNREWYRGKASDQWC